MSRFDDKHVMITGCTVVWDGVTRPETDQKTGKIKYTLKVVIPPNSPDLAEFDQLAQETLRGSQFQGQLPAGGLMPIGVTKPNEFNNLFPGFAVISAKSHFAPDVYDETGALLDPMQYGPSIYSGQQVDILVHCYAYDKAGNRGISAGLDGLRIVASAQAPKLDIGTGGVNTAAAFGAGAAVPPAIPAPVAAPVYPGQPVVQAPVPLTQPVTTSVPPPPDPAAVAPAYPQQATNFLLQPQVETRQIIGYDRQGQPIYQQ